MGDAPQPPIVLALLPWFSQIKMAHVALVVASGALFALRGGCVLAGRNWVMERSWRMLSYAIDTALLVAGVALWTMLSLNPLTHHWLAVKLSLLLAYIALGSMALKRARTQRVRLGCFAAALVIYGLMASVAGRYNLPRVFLSWIPHAG